MKYIAILLVLFASCGASKEDDLKAKREELKALTIDLQVRLQPFYDSAMVKRNDAGFNARMKVLTDSIELLGAEITAIEKEIRIEK